MSKHFRSPLFDIFRDRSPYAGLDEHASKLLPCLDALEATLAVFWSGGDVEAAAQKVNDLELEADLVKSNLRNHLPAGVRMSVDKTLFLQLLSEQDRILDGAQDAAVWMTMRPASGTHGLDEDFANLLQASRATVEKYLDAVSNLHDLLETGFVPREREEEKALIHEVHELEHKADVIEHALAKKLLNPALEEKVSAVSIAHLLHLAHTLSMIADAAENAADRLRAMMAR